MSDFLEQLISHTLAAPVVVRPRPLSVFEPSSVAVPPRADGPEEATPQMPSPPFPTAMPVAVALPSDASPVLPPPALRVPAPPTASEIQELAFRPAHRVAPPAAPPAASNTIAQQQEKPPLPMPPTAPAASSPQALVKQVVRDTAPPAVHTVVDRVTRRIVEKAPSGHAPPPIVERRLIRPEPKLVAERETPAAPAPSLKTLVQQMVLQPVTRDIVRQSTTEPTLTPPTRPAGPPPEVARHEPPPSPRRREAPPPVLKPQTEQVPAFFEMPPPVPPTIRVTIGRIEVRATTETAPASVPSRPQPVVMSLDDYLAQRAGGDRR